MWIAVAWCIVCRWNGNGRTAHMHVAPESCVVLGRSCGLRWSKRPDLARLSASRQQFGCAVCARRACHSRRLRMLRTCLTAPGPETHVPSCPRAGDPQIRRGPGGVPRTAVTKHGKPRASTDHIAHIGLVSWLADMRNALTDCSQQQFDPLSAHWPFSVSPALRSPGISCSCFSLALAPLISSSKWYPLHGACPLQPFLLAIALDVTSGLAHIHSKVSTCDVRTYATAIMPAGPQLGHRWLLAASRPPLPHISIASPRVAEERCARVQPLNSNCATECSWCAPPVLYYAPAPSGLCRLSLRFT